MSNKAASKRRLSYKILPDQILQVLNHKTLALAYRRQYFMAMLTIGAPTQLQDLLIPQLLDCCAEMKALNKCNPERLERTVGALAHMITELSSDRDATRQTTDRAVPEGPSALTSIDRLLQRYLPGIERWLTSPEGKFSWLGFKETWSRRHDDIGQEIDTALVAWQTRHHLSDPWVAPFLRIMLDYAVIAHFDGIDPLAAIHEGLVTRRIPGDLLSRPNVESDFVTTFLDGGHIRSEWLPEPDDDLAEWREVMLEAFNEFLDDELKAPPLQQTVDPDLPAEKRQPEHYVWLARLQVGGESRSAIGRTLPGKPESNRRMVGNAVKKTADDIGLTLWS